MSLLTPLLGAAASGLLQRTYLMEGSTFNFIPRILCVFDAIVEENPEFLSSVTEHPVEDGPEITDHIQLKNPKLTLRGTMSNTPTDLSVAIANIAAAGVTAVTSSQFRTNFLNTGLQSAAGAIGTGLLGGSLNAGLGQAAAADAIGRSILLDAWQRKARFDVVTKRQRYESMVIEKMVFPRNQTTGGQLIFELNLKTIRVVSPLQVKLTSVAEDVTASASGDTNLGSQSTTGVSDQAQSGFGGSWLRGLVNGVRGG